MFQFKKVNGVLHTLNEIDIIACNVWSKNYDSKHYAQPDEYYGPNWFDAIGMAIEHCKDSRNTSDRGVCSWSDVRATLLRDLLWCGRDVELSDYKLSMEIIYPYIKLTHVLQDLGVEPIAL